MVILDFWSVGCGPCRDDLPGLAKLHEAREEMGIVIVGVHTAGCDREAIAEAIEEFRLGYPTLIDAPIPGEPHAWGRLYAHYGVKAIPHSVLIDRRGRIAAAGRPEEVVARARQIAASKED